MNKDTCTITANDIHALTPEQLDSIEIRAAKRYRHMRAIAGQLGDITLAVAALAIEIIDEVNADTTTLVYIIAQEDLRVIVRSYLCRWKLSVFPYTGGSLMDYISYADFTRIAACIG